MIVSAVLLTNATFSNQLLFDLTPIKSQLKVGGVAQVTANITIQYNTVCMYDGDVCMYVCM